MKNSTVSKIIIIFEIYLLGVLLLYFIGPIKWNTPSAIKLVVFLLSAYLCLYCGYWHYQKRHKFDNIVESVISARALKFYIYLMLILNLVVMGLYLFRFLGSTSISLTNLISWIQNPATQYMQKLDSKTSGFWGMVGALATFCSLFLWGTIPFGMIYYKRLSKPFQCILIANIVVEVLRWLFTGTNKGLVDIVLLFLALVIYNFCSRKITISKKMKYIVLAVAFVVLVLMYFVQNIDQRLANVTRVNYIGNPGNIVDTDNIIYKLFPPIESIQSYLTQGYYGLSLGLEENVVPMFGLGSSDFLTQNISEILGIDLSQYTYMYRIDESMWKPRTNWHSAFLWFANDFGPLGSLIYTYIIGYYIGYVVHHLFVKKDIFYFPLFCMCVQLIFYLPMNNQIFQMPFSFMGFVGFNLFIILRKKFGFRPIVITLNKA